VAARRARRAPSRQGGGQGRGAGGSRGAPRGGDVSEGRDIEMKEPSKLQGRAVRPQSAPPQGGREDDGPDGRGGQQPTARQTLLKRAASTAARPLGYLWGMAGGR
jgi:hypothetical protein